MTADPTLNDTQDRIDKWHRDTFGAQVALGRMAAKMSEEHHEFQRAVHTQEGEVRRMEELADIVIVAFAIAGRDGRDLSHFIERKLTTLEGRGKEQIARDAERGIPSEETH